MISINEPLTQIPGIGDRKEKQLHEYGLKDINDIIRTLPLRYDDFSKEKKFSEAMKEEGSVVFTEVTISSIKSLYTKKGLASIIVCTDGMHTCSVWIFGYQSTAKKIQVDQTVWMHATVKPGHHGLQASKAQFIQPDQRHELQMIVPVYSRPTKAHWSQKQFTQWVNYCLEHLPSDALAPVPEYLGLVEKNELEILRILHNPPSIEAVHDAQKKIGLIKLAEQFEHVIENASSITHKKAHQCLKHDIVHKWQATLPFSLSDEQIATCRHILKEMAHPIPMNRIIQGEVGSGKTVLAGFAACLAAENGYHVAFMAPTEVLAWQQAQTLLRWFEPFGLGVTFISGSMTARQRKVALESIKTGEALIIVGTHALFSDDIIYPTLGLIIIDEHHRFGVAQHEKLLKKGTSPHQLTMTATPLPRTLTLMTYGELHVSYLKNSFCDSKKINTRIVYDNRIYEIFDYIDNQIEQNKLSFLVNPSIEPYQNVEGSSNMGIHDLHDLFLKHTGRSSHDVAIIHGKMSFEEKQNALKKFREKEVKLLIATTVIETGIDIPDASTIVIMSAHRFGLSQIHQLRGRVGRRGQTAACIVVVPKDIEGDSLARFQYLKKAEDGFALAEADWNLRGPGMMKGTEQSGWKFIGPEIWRDKALVLETFKKVAEAKKNPS